jgi:hypothetical protein
MTKLIMASQGCQSGERSRCSPRLRNEEGGTVTVKSEKPDRARLRRERSARHAEEVKQYLPIGDDQMPA